MPLPKPDKKEVARICRSRGIGYDQENLFEPVSEAAINALSGGFIDQPKARSLLAWLDDNPAISAIYPNAQLALALKVALAPGGWTSEREHDLLRFIDCVYRDIGSLRDNLSELLEKPPALFTDLYSPLFDDPPSGINLLDRLCAFTGPCEFGSRRECYDAVLRNGGAPIQVLAATDYLFVAAKHIKGRILSSSMVDAICIRMIFGRLAIYAEAHFRPG